ncbi:MAG: DUF1615 family protein [bacterium]|nr:DUF1615 family protein [bacterium]
MGTTIRVLGWTSLWLCAIYGAGHLLSTLYFGFDNLAPARRPRTKATRALEPAQQRLVSALSRVLAEDGVTEAGRWAEAIVRAAPTTDPGYIALVTAQVRRESHFLATDLEWLFMRLVPDLVHELGVPDPIRTIGPMQVQRWRLHDVFERTLGRELDAHDIKQLAADIEVGVAACVAVLDPIVRNHVPDRRLLGWFTSQGATGLTSSDDRTLARDWLGTLPAERGPLALLQKHLSDLTRTPIALDGVIGERTREIANLLVRDLAPPLRADFAATELPPRALATVRRLWERRYGPAGTDRIAPRITHDPRLAFVFADFNSGNGASRTAALQFLLRDATAPELAVDGKFGPRTRAAMRRLFAEHVADTTRRADYLALIDAGHKPRWVRAQAFELAAALWRTRHDHEPPTALVPDLWHSGFAQDVKGIGRISVEGYVAGSAAFFEDYYARLLTYTGHELAPAEADGAASPR